jgi:hypothetical protein
VKTEPSEFLVMALGDGTHRVRLDRLADGRIMCQLCFDHFHIADLNPVEGGVEDICKPCARVEYLRGIDAHITHGTKYHTDSKCPAMIHGELLHDWESDDYAGGFLAGSYRIVTNVNDATMRGKLPCLHCVPAELRVFPPLYGQTFGHEPVALGVVIHEAWTNHSACTECKARTTPLVCARCMEFDDSGMWRIPAHPVHWPCTSAIVLGLAPRTEAA